MLGPILFVLYTVDLIQLVESHRLSPHLYADDVKSIAHVRLLQSTPTAPDPPSDADSHVPNTVLVYGSGHGALYNRCYYKKIIGLNALVHSRLDHGNALVESTSRRVGLQA